MKVTQTPVDLSKLLRPSDHNVPWFTISNSMSETYSSCREAVVWQYVHHISKKFGDANFLKRNCIVFVVRQKFMSLKDYSIKDTIQYFLRSEAKNAVENSGSSWYEWEEHIKENVLDLDPIEQGLKLAWLFPTPDQKWKYFTYHEFLRQCQCASEMIIDYINEWKLKPLYIETTGPIVQKTLTAPLEVDGEILDETDGKPTMMKAQVNLFTSDCQLFVWKISNKRSSEKDDVAMYSETVDNQCAVVASHFRQLVSFPMKVHVVKAVIKKTGEKVTLEAHHRKVTEEEIKQQKAKLAIKAKDVKAMNLFKERSYRCPNCDYYDICIRKDSDKFIKRVYGETAEAMPDDDDSGMPF